MGDLTVHHDMRGNRTHLVLSLSGAVALLSAGVLWGRMDNRVSHLEVEMERRPTSAELAAIRTDVQDIKAGVRALNDYLIQRADARKE